LARPGARFTRAGQQTWKRQLIASVGGKYLAWLDFQLRHISPDGRQVPLPQARADEEDAHLAASQPPF